MGTWESMSLAQRVKVAIGIRGITAIQLAKQSGVSKHTIYQIYAGRFPAKVETIQRLAKGLNVRTGWLLEGEEPIYRPVETTKAAELDQASAFRRAPALPHTVAGEPATAPRQAIPRSRKRKP